MTLVLHLTVAFGSMALTTFAYFFPSQLKLRITYALVGLTFVSGFWLVFMKPAHLVSACISGLIYLGFVGVGIVATRNKLARVTVEQ